MRVFSASIETFLQRVTLYTRDILRREFKVRVARTRFHTGDGWTWPIVLVAIDDRDRLGYFNADNCAIAVNKSLMYTAKERVIKDLLRHELAHYFTFIERGAAADHTAHGPEFRAICDKYQLPERVRLATADVRAENEAIVGDLASEEVINKVRKLMSLAESDNENEAALATLRANELMVKHNLDSLATLGGAGEIEYCVKLVIPSKRSSPRLSAIARILEEFFVYPVQASGGLEVTGTRSNVENAEYIAHYLNRELAAIWKRARSGNRRLREKSFMSALATSYKEKLMNARGRLPVSDQKALVRLNQELERAGHGVYGGALRSSSSSYQLCRESAQHGSEAGSKLDIRRGVGTSGTVKLLQG